MTGAVPSAWGGGHAISVQVRFHSVHAAFICPLRPELRDSQRAAPGEHYRHHGGGGGASDRDQRTILDPEYGIGLFTRYLIEGLAGRADEAPIGNGDKRIDTVEL
jgi:hypothetical protein